MMMAVAMLPCEGRRWGNCNDDDGKEEVVEVRWTTTTRPSRRWEVAAGERVGSRCPQGGRQMGGVTTKLAQTRGGNYDCGGDAVSRKQAVGRSRQR